ncbi:MAG: DEAD/DEAH box helicase [Myxococcota bacterium]
MTTHDLDLRVEWHSVVSSHGGMAQLRAEVVLTPPGGRSGAQHPAVVGHIRNEITLGRLQPARAREGHFLQWLGTTGAWRVSHEHGDPRHYVAVADAGEWLARWSGSGLLWWRGGDEVVAAPEVARFVVRTEDREPQWMLELPRGGQDALLLPLSDVDLLVSDDSPPDFPRIHLRRGAALHRVDAGGLTLPLLEAIRRAPLLPLDRVRQLPQAQHVLAPFLDRAGALPVPREVDVLPSAAFKLSPMGELEITAWAEAADGTRFNYAFNAHWTVSLPASLDTTLEPMPAETPAAPPAPDAATARALFVTPRREDVAALESWLQALTVDVLRAARVADAVLRGWTEKSARPALLRVWETRPGHVRYLGNRPFRDAVTPRPPPRFQVRVERSGIEWLSVSVGLQEELERLDLQELLRVLRTAQDQELVILRSGEMYRRAELEPFKAQLEALADLGLEPRRDVEVRLHAAQLAGVRAETLSTLSEFSSELGALAAAIRKHAASFKGIPKAGVPVATARHLRPYQRQGVDFVAWSTSIFGGALLADEMGLGKTLQVLAALTALRAGRKRNLPTLVICPASVVRNWEREAQRFAPGLRVGLLERGPGRQHVLSRLARLDVVVTNFALARMEIEALIAQRWLMVVVDEAQAIKNPQSGIAHAVKRLQARHRVALTGTPIENRLQDLESIMDFAVPGHLGSLDALQPGADDETLVRGRRILRARLRPVLLRRLKQEVAPELPPRIEERLDCEMTPAQRRLYAAELKRARMVLEDVRDDRVVGQDRVLMLTVLTRLRQLCCDPAVLGITGVGSGKVEEFLELMTGLLEGGHKVLVFSQFVRVLERLRPLLRDRRVTQWMLTGKTQGRDALVREFEAHEGPGAFLISLKAGGSGLNLVSASQVIIFDPWWNPAVEAQAIDRTHRIGQRKTVTAFRLVTRDTVEERIMELQERKRALVRGVLEEEAFNRTLTREDFEFLLAPTARREAGDHPPT